MTMRRYLYIMTVLLALTAGQATAQRCLPKMQGIGLRAGMADGFYSNNPGSGAGYYFGATLSSYGKGGNKWVYGAEYLQTHRPYRTKRLPVTQMTGEGGYYYNFLSDKGKTVFLYLGGSALAGYESVNWGDKRMYDGATLRNKDAFIYGCAATLEMEVYLSDAVALTASLRERFLWGGSTGTFRTQYGIGIKFILN